VAARAYVSFCRAAWELAAGDFLKRLTQDSTAKVGSELPPDHRIAKIRSPEALHLLVEVVAVGRRTIGLLPDAKPGVGRFDRVQHFPRTFVLPLAAAKVEIGKGLSNRPKGRLVGGPAPLPAGAFVHSQAAPMDERARGEVSEARVAPAIEVGEQTGKHPEHEVWRQLNAYLPAAARE